MEPEDYRKGFVKEMSFKSSLSRKEDEGVSDGPKRTRSDVCVCH